MDPCQLSVFSLTQETDDLQNNLMMQPSSGVDLIKLRLNDEFTFPVQEQLCLELSDFSKT